jgi:hypothetical protein
MKIEERAAIATSLLEKEFPIFLAKVREDRPEVDGQGKVITLNNKVHLDITLSNLPEPTNALYTRFFCEYLDILYHREIRRKEEEKVGLIGRN